VAVAALLVVGLVVLSQSGSGSSQGADERAAASSTYMPSGSIQGAATGAPGMAGSSNAPGGFEGSPATAVPSPGSSVEAARPAGRLPGEPDPALTPGALNPAVTPATIGSTICVAGYSSRIRPPSDYTSALKRRQIAEYGYADPRLSSYEEDHLIPLSIGGAPRDPRNLWPEPRNAALPDGTDVGATTKDRFEVYLHERVCSGAIALGIAQRQMASDWVRAWEAAGRP